MGTTVGDATQPYIDVYPHDGTTTATLKVMRPDGTEDTPAVGAGVEAQIVDEDTGQSLTVLRFTAPPILLDQARSWVLLWTTTGTGAGSEAQRIWVEATPVAGGVAWSPGLSHVAVYIPQRTIAVANASNGRPILTFDDSTKPSGDQVGQLITDAVAWVIDAVGTLDPTLYASGTSVAAIRAAGLAELAWPLRPEDINTGQALLAQADLMLKSLVARNDVLTEAPVDPDVAALAVMPVWSFPAPALHGDLLL